MSQIAPESIEELSELREIESADTENNSVIIREFANSLAFGRIRRSENMMISNVDIVDEYRLRVNIKFDDE